MFALPYRTLSTVQIWIWTYDGFARWFLRHHNSRRDNYHNFSSIACSLSLDLYTKNKYNIRGSNTLPLFLLYYSHYLRGISCTNVLGSVDIGLWQWDSVAITIIIVTHCHNSILSSDKVVLCYFDTRNGKIIPDYPKMCCLPIWKAIQNTYTGKMSTLRWHWRIEQRSNETGSVNIRWSIWKSSSRTYLNFQRRI
jgi:hypothetical protein